MPKSKDFEKRLLVAITGSKECHWKNKIREINNYKFPEVSLFLECFNPKQRRGIYLALEKSCVKSIPLVHARHDMEKWEFKYLKDKYQTKCFNIHEDHFDNLIKWKGFYKYLYLEMNYDNFVSKKVDVSKIGGFCIDLSHFKASEEKWSKDFEYVLKRRKKLGIFRCNHLNGYSYKKNTDIHYVTNLKQFDYLKTLPEFVFGDYIGIEVNNCIKTQIKFKKYLISLLNKKFNS